eukprot:7390625-Prymnesium_polylepis.1
MKQRRAGSNAPRDVQDAVTTWGLNSVKKDMRDVELLLRWNTSVGHVLKRGNAPSIDLGKRHVVDCFLFNDELPMLLARLAEHESFVTLFVIVESTHTFAGEQKALHASVAMASGQLDAWRHKIRLVTVNGEVPPKQVLRAPEWLVHCATFGPVLPHCSVAGQPNLEQEVRARALAWDALMLWVADGSIPGTAALIVSADVDEIYSMAAFGRLLDRLEQVRAFSVTLTAHVYRLGCQPVYPHRIFVPRRLRVVIAADAYTDHLNLPFGTTPHLRGIQLSMTPVNRKPIAEFGEPVGWHMTNFMTAEQLLAKMGAYSHSQEPYVRRVVSMGTSFVRHAIQLCQSIFTGSGEFEQLESVELADLPIMPQVINRSSSQYSASITALLTGDMDGVDPLSATTPVVHVGQGSYTLLAPTGTPPGSNSWAQYGQDLKLDVLLNHARDGTFVEIGGYDGETFSNTLFFERHRGWRGLLVEPNPFTFRQLLSRSRNCTAFQCC